MCHIRLLFFVFRTNSHWTQPGRSITIKVIRPILPIGPSGLSSLWTLNFKGTGQGAGVAERNHLLGESNRHWRIPFTTPCEEKIDMYPLFSIEGRRSNQQKNPIDEHPRSHYDIHS